MKCWLLLSLLSVSVLFGNVLDQLPVRFEPEVGGFVVRAAANTYYVTEAGSLRTAPGVEMRLAGANATPRSQPVHALSGKTHYLRGSDPARWRTNVPQYTEVRFQQVYPGIDLIYHGGGADLEYDFWVAPHAEPGRIVLQFSGADSVRIDAQGELITSAGAEQLRFRRPRISQDGSPVGGGYRLLGNKRVSFQFASYDRERPLLIDPVLAFTTLYGAQGGTGISAMALDPAGNIYIAGTAITIPPVNALQATPGSGNCGPEHPSPCQDVFVAKLDPTATQVIYSTYLGDNDLDQLGGLAVDAQGNAYIAATSYPPSAFGTPGGSLGEGFIRKLNPAGSALVYDESTGSATQANAIALDSSGNALVTGTSYSASFVAVHALQSQSALKTLLVTHDGGSSTWQPLNFGALQVYALAIPANQSSTVYAASSAGLFKSVDGGASWTNLIPSAAAATAVAVDPHNPSTVYAAYGSSASDATTLARSTDAGATWAVISGGIPLQFPPELGQAQVIGSVAIDPTNSAVIWVGGVGYAGPAIYKSRDGGTTWQTVFAAEVLPISQPLYPSSLVIDPSNTAHVYACCATQQQGGGIYFTLDGGATWTQSMGALSAPAFDKTNPSVLYSTSATVVRSTDSGMTWTPLNVPGLPPQVISFNNVLVDSTGTIDAISGAGYLIRSSDSGNTWTITPGPWNTSATLLSVDPLLASTIYVSSPSAGIQDAFVTKLDASGATIWATLLGGSNDDAGQAIAVDGQGNAYIAGSTSSSDFPLANPLQSALGNGTGIVTNAFVSEISADGTQLVYSTYLGGSGPDMGLAITVDSVGNTYVAGSTGGPNFPIVNPLLSTWAYNEGFAAKISPKGQKQAYSTYFYQVPSVIAVDSGGDAWLAGSTAPYLPNLPLVQPVQIGWENSNFVSELAPAGNTLRFSTYFAQGCLAESNYAPIGFALAGNGSFWLAGIACTPDFPTVNSSEPLPQGTTGYLARIDPVAPPGQPGLPQVDSVYNAASYIPGDVVAPGEIVSLFGSNLAPSAQSTAQLPLPASLNGVSVSIGGLPAPLYYVSPDQINLQVPSGLQAGGTMLVVTSGSQSGAPRAMRVIATAPAIFLGNGTAIVTHGADYSLVTPQNPAHPGEYLIIFCNDLGPTTPAISSGDAAPLEPAPLVASYSVVVGGREVSAPYAGLAPGWAGLYQVNFQLPTDTSSGLTDVYVSIGASATNDVLLYVQ